jgi:2-keto-3-deoxy-L-rhamnonate aldolase RhmA
MSKSSLRAMTRTRDVKVGHFVVEFTSPGIGHLIRNAGCDFVLFDTEHSGFHFETIKSVLRYFEAAGLPAIVRVPSKEYHHVARALDMGAEGLMVPMVSSVEEVRSVVQSMKYTPQGQRGVALGIAHDGRCWKSSARRTSAARCSRRSRRPQASRTPKRLPPRKASTACGSDIST